MSTSSPRTPTAPDWPHCGEGADPAGDPIGCTGIRVLGFAACLAHLAEGERRRYLRSLAPGAAVDHRGTRVSGLLLTGILDALTDPATGNARFGAARFEEAVFPEEARFCDVRFSGRADFSGAQFAGAAQFDQAQFEGRAGFRDTRFGGQAVFRSARFHDGLWCDGAAFSRQALFDRAEVSGPAVFRSTEFAHDVRFQGARFSDGAYFERAVFTGGDASFADAVFDGEALFQQARLADVAFDRTRFGAEVRFSQARFEGDAQFDRVRFAGEAWFDKARFGHAGSFLWTRFEDEAWFPETHFTGHAQFHETRFAGRTSFRGVRFGSDAWLDRAVFAEEATFEEVYFASSGSLAEARFALLPRFGPVVCRQDLDLSGALFEVPLTLEVAAREVRCLRTRWEATATLRLRCATLDLGQAVLSAPVAVIAHPAPFAVRGRTLPEGPLAGSPEVRVASVQGVDAAHLVLTDTDLTDCLFTGAFHLDQLRLEGRCTFAGVPTGWHRRGAWPARWTRRRTLAEEHHWRAHRAGAPVPAAGEAPSPAAWRTGPHHADAGLTPDPEDVVATYRQLRKAFEDGKNEPGAADFYYGEMEMRRHDRAGTPAGERGLLHGYWLLSGYGLRASRALGWLAAAMLTTVVLLMGFGIPGDSPKQRATGTLPAAGGRLALTVDTADPRNPTGARFTGKRFDKALGITLNSVVFRSSGQDLTTAGGYIEMTSRLLEPTLLALAVLAVRGRVKR
ncbi:pentapeptide repeat-containing protein [Streptomyces sp. NPDC089919]|uniref:pentapeptide repeat-containing protein n=1 Tax=Streptomyces sp. NPDC089919 TaxID=3155188 RepID=UPI0034216893